MATQFVILFFSQLYCRLDLPLFIPGLIWGMSLMNIRKNGHLSWWSFTKGLSVSDCPLATERQINKRELLSRSPCQWLTKRPKYERIAEVIDSVIIMANMYKFGIHLEYEWMFKTDCATWLCWKVMFFIIIASSFISTKNSKKSECTVFNC